METNEAGSRKRPVWVLIISIFYLLSASWTLFSFYLILTGSITLQPAQKEYFENLTVLDYSFTILTGLANLIGAVTLFLLRRHAFYFFTGTLILNVLMTVWHAVSKGWIQAIGGPGLVGALIGMGILVAICIYSWRLTKAGVLR